MKSKTPLLGLLLTVTFTLSLFSCANDETAESTEYPGIIKTPDGYRARPAQAISTVAFYRLFTEGGWIESSYLDFFPDGKVYHFSDDLGWNPTLLGDINESSLHRLYLGEMPRQTFQYEQLDFLYDEAGNTLKISTPYHHTSYIVLSITENEMCLANHGGDGVLTYINYKHLTAQSVQEILGSRRELYTEIPSHIGLRETAAGYEPVVTPIKAATFLLQFATSGGWQRTEERYIYEDGRVDSRNWETAPGEYKAMSMLNAIQDDKLHELSLGIWPDGSKNYSSIEYLYTYDETRNTLVWGRDYYARSFVITSITDEEIRGTTKLMADEKEAIESRGEKSPVLKYWVLKHITNEFIQWLLKDE